MEKVIIGEKPNTTTVYLVRNEDMENGADQVGNTLFLAMCVDQSFEYYDKHGYTSDMAFDMTWWDHDLEKYSQSPEIPDERIDALLKLFEATHRSVEDISKESNMSLYKLAERFSIPYHTMENWCKGIDDCPLYIRLMMQECLGLYDTSIFLKTKNSR